MHACMHACTRSTVVRACVCVCVRARTHVCVCVLALKEGVEHRRSCENTSDIKATDSLSNTTKQPLVHDTSRDCRRTLHVTCSMHQVAKDHTPRRCVLSDSVSLATDKRTCAPSTTPFLYTSSTQTQTGSHAHTRERQLMPVSVIGSTLCANASIKPLPRLRMICGQSAAPGAEGMQGQHTFNTQHALMHASGQQRNNIRKSPNYSDLCTHVGHGYLLTLRERFRHASTTVPCHRPLVTAVGGS